MTNQDHIEAMLAKLRERIQGVKMIIGIISPYSGDTERNTAFLRAIVRSILAEGHTPLAGHALYPQVLDDTNPEQRAQGMAAGQHLLTVCCEVRVYDQLGMSAGMRADLEFCGANQVPFRFARLDGWEYRQAAAEAPLPPLPDGWRWVAQREDLRAQALAKATNCVALGAWDCGGRR